MTLAMLGLAGIPATAGFIGKFYLIDAAVSGSYTWLGVMIVIGSMISLGYYLPVVSVMWMRDAPVPADPLARGGLPAIAGGSPELDVDPPPGGGDPGAERRSGTERRRAPDRRAGATAVTHAEVALVALLAGAGTLFFGIVPQPLFELVRHAGTALGLR
jgi:NADH-quinone oxidoreductase subunit N